MDEDEQPRKRVRLSGPEDNSEHGQRSAEVHSDEQEKEARVGINEFVNAGAPVFTGIFKQRQY